MTQTPATRSYNNHLWECALERIPSGVRLAVDPFGAVTKTDIGYWRKSDGTKVEAEDLAQAISEHGCIVSAAD